MLGAVLSHIRNARQGWLVLAVLVYMCVIPLWAMQWRRIARVLGGNGATGMLGTVAIVATLNNTVPGLVAEGSAMVLLASRNGLGARQP